MEEKRFRVYYRLRNDPGIYGYLACQEEDAALDRMEFLRLTDPDWIYYVFPADTEAKIICDRQAYPDYPATELGDVRVEGDGLRLPGGMVKPEHWEW